MVRGVISTSVQHDPQNPFASMRENYTSADSVEDSSGMDLGPEDLDDGWLPCARRWLTAAASAGVPEPNALVLGTVDELGHPATRTVLCKGIDTDGITFFTNYGSDKARHLDAVPYASATFVWLPLHRQISIRGPVTRVSTEETETYWRTRPRGSQLGAWASQQSRPVASRADLDHALVEAGERFGVDVIPVPPFWGGFRISPDFVEFWQGRPNRMHNRVRTRLLDGRWHTQRLQP